MTEVDRPNKRIEVVDNRLVPEECEWECGQCQNCLEAEVYQAELEDLRAQASHQLHTERLFGGYYDRTPEPYEPDVLDDDIPF